MDNKGPSVCCKTESARASAIVATTKSPPEIAMLMSAAMQPHKGPANAKQEHPACLSRPFVQGQGLATGKIKCIP